MRILVTNDDGVTAEGLAVAEAAAREIAADAAGRDGEVWVAAPAFEQSGVSHAISFTTPVKLESLGPRRHAVAGTPADCVIIAVHELMRDAPPDLVISGVNRGHNIAEDAVYSGTVGGAIEGVLQGVRAIALSQYFSRPADPDAPWDPFASARGHATGIVRKLLALEWSKDLFFNVNFPPIPADAVKGARFARQGRRADGVFAPELRNSPGGRPYFWLSHRRGAAGAGPDEDHGLCADGWITVVPMRPDYTAADDLARLMSKPLL